MNKEDIINILRDLHDISGFRVSLHGDDYREIAAYPESPCSFCEYVNADASEHERCLACDKDACERAIESKSTYIYQCRHGLVEAVCPLYNFGVLTGFLMVGQVVSDETGREKIYKTLRRFRQSHEIAKISADAVPVISKKTIPSYVNIMTICAQYITLSNAFPSKRVTVAELAKKYIHDNYRKKIGIKDICASIGCSKSTLTASFKRECGMTVNEYIISVRMDTARELLRGKEKTINEISVFCGFSDQAYFSKVFSARYGISPSQYKTNSTMHSQEAPK